MHAVAADPAQTGPAFTRTTIAPEPRAPRLARLSDLLGELEADAVAAHEAYRDGTARGPITGLRPLDRELGGALPAGTHVIHGGPGTGKSALGLQLAGDCGTPALYVSAEMGALELFRRCIARTTGTFLGKLKSGELSPSEVVGLARIAAGKTPGLAILDATQAGATADLIRELATEVRGDARHVLVVVDSIHSWAASTAGDLDEYTRLGAALGAVRALATALDSPILVVSERNRSGMKGGGLSAGAGHRGLEYGCESLWELDRDEGAASSLSGAVEVTLKIAKNRNGSPGKQIALRFDGARQQFTEA